MNFTGEQIPFLFLQQRHALQARNKSCSGSSHYIISHLQFFLFKMLKVNLKLLPFECLANFTVHIIQKSMYGF